MIVYNIIFSEDAADVRNSLPEERQVTLRRALAALAEDPHTTVSSSIKGDQNTRSVALTSSLTVDYVISDGLMVILVIHVVDTSQVLLEED